MRYDLGTNLDEWVIHLSPEELGDIRSALHWAVTVVLAQPLTADGLEMKRRFTNHYHALGGKQTISTEEETTR